MHIIRLDILIYLQAVDKKGQVVGEGISDITVYV